MEKIEEIYKVPNEYVKVVVNDNNDIKSLLFTGKLGQGKTFGTLDTLDKLGVSYVYRSGYTSPLKLYLFLYENREKDKVIVFDDTYGLMNKDSSAILLLNALFGNKGHREVVWDSSTQHLEKAPKSFLFEAKIILITNNLPKKYSSELIKSRCLTYRFNFSVTELLEVMEEISKKEHPKLTAEERTEVFNFIKSKVDETTDNFDLRVQSTVENLFLYDKTKWKELASPMIEKKNHKLVLLKKFLEETSSMKEVGRMWKEAGLGSERQMFRYKERL